MGGGQQAAGTRHWALSTERISANLRAYLILRAHSRGTSQGRLFIGNLIASLQLTSGT